MIGAFLAKVGLPAATPWIALGFMAAIAGSGAWGYLKGHGDASSSCRQAALQQELEAARTSLAASQRAAQTAQEAERNISAARLVDQQRIAEYDQILQGRDPCSLSPDDVERLRQLGSPRPSDGATPAIVPRQ